MDLKTELVALAVRVLSAKTNVVQKPDQFTELLTVMFGGESYDRRLARSIVADSENAVTAVKQFRTNRQFKKITKNI